MTAQRKYRALVAGGKQTLATALNHAWTLRCVVQHPQVPWLAKIVAGVSGMYLVSPIQLIPGFIPVLGQMDDLFVLYVGMKIIRKLTPEKILAECEQSSDRPALLQRIFQQCGEQKDESSASQAVTT
jgi:uncharacterized membrane protein YkvA (DUF1232 family)